MFKGQVRIDGYIQASVEHRDFDICTIETAHYFEIYAQDFEDKNKTIVLEIVRIK